LFDELKQNLRISRSAKQFSSDRGSKSNCFFGPANQPKLNIDAHDSRYEHEANMMASSVTALSPAKTSASFFQSANNLVNIQRKCASCENEELHRKNDGANSGAGMSAPSVVHDVVNSPGQALDMKTRNFMESRFDRDFGNVQIHNDDIAHQSSSRINALAYTHKDHIVFSAGRYEPETDRGKQLLAHELTHVVQQSGGNSGSIQRSPHGTEPLPTASKNEADFKKWVKQGLWCKDSAKTGELHPGLQCYREITSKDGYPEAHQACFNKTTGQWVEDSPDFITAVSGQNKDGTCDIPLGLFDPPNPFTFRGRRALGHFIGDIATEDANMVGRNFGAVAGISMGIALPKGGSDLLGFAVPAILGVLAYKLGNRGLPALNSFAFKHGFVPTVSLGFNTGLDLSLGIGLEKRDKPLPVIPINSYLSFNLDNTLSFNRDPDLDASLTATVAIRVDPGKQGGPFAIGSIGAGVEFGDNVSAVATAGIGIGYRATDFMDVQIVRESVSGDSDRDGTYMLTLKLIAPKKVLDGHKRRAK
jgi:hypothetical protein